MRRSSRRRKIYWQRPWQPNPRRAEKVFADLARGNSEDPATAKNGGFLPRPVKKNPNKVDALYDRAVDMEEGQVFDIPIKYADNWYLLRRGAAVAKTFEEAKPELLASQRNTQWIYSGAPTCGARQDPFEGN